MATALGTASLKKQESSESERSGRRRGHSAPLSLSLLLQTEQEEFGCLFLFTKAPNSDVFKMGFNKTKNQPLGERTPGDCGQGDSRVLWTTLPMKPWCSLPVNV